MGSDVSTQNGSKNQDPPTPSTVRSFPEEVAHSVRSPPIDSTNSTDARGGRLSRFLSDALPGSKTHGKAPIPQEIHVVREGFIESTPTVDQDPEMRHLLSLPSFLPIIKSSVNLPASKDPDVGNRLDYRKILMVGLRYQQYLRQCSDLVVAEQQNVISCVKDVEQDLSREVASLSERQKLMAKYSETFNTIPEITKTLEKVDQSLSKTIAAVENLNLLLPLECRLPVFKFNE